MEFVSEHDIPVAELTTAGAGGTVSREIPIPPGARIWTVLVHPIDSGPATADPTAKYQYQIQGVFKDTNPALSAPAVRNKINITSREDAVNRVKLVLTLGVDPQPDGGVEVRLSMTRRAP